MYFFYFNKHLMKHIDSDKSTQLLSDWIQTTQVLLASISQAQWNVHIQKCSSQMESPRVQ